MMNAMYVPIVKGKLNDLKAVGKLEPRLRALTKPLIEAMPLDVEKTTLEKHVFLFCEYIRKHVPLGDIAVDFYGLMPDAILDDGTNAVLHGYQLLKAFGRQVTPVFGLERNDDLWAPLGVFTAAFGAGFAFRLRRDDLADDLHEETWQGITQRSAQMGIKESDTDLVLDFAEVSSSELGALAETVVSFLFANPRIRNYRSVVIAGSSALRTVAEVAKDDMSSVTRSELHLWSNLWLDMPDELKPVFSDYGVVHPDFSDIGPNQNINGKIRYTVGDKILYFRGHGLKKPVKDYDQYHEIARRVAADPRFRGRGFSIGDATVADCARGLIGPGSPQTWVTADMNHHLAYTCLQVQRLIAEFVAEPNSNAVGALVESV